ncbi:Hypothetical predicted protein [Marmota monax]|uniref:Uncharacterized protein n=1 Tax=Marmota monax TaxID=9995 RepID=A0A5E4C408_MARMO|nr:Hypothetical predicted protein [Marmota monax]
MSQQPGAQRSPQRGALGLRPAGPTHRVESVGMWPIPASRLKDSQLSGKGGRRPPGSRPALGSCFLARPLSGALPELHAKQSRRHRPAPQARDTSGPKGAHTPGRHPTSPQLQGRKDPQTAGTAQREERPPQHPGTNRGTPTPRAPDAHRATRHPDRASDRAERSRDLPQYAHQNPALRSRGDVAKRDPATPRRNDTDASPNPKRTPNSQERPGTAKQHKPGIPGSHLQMAPRPGPLQHTKMEPRTHHNQNTQVTQSRMGREANHHRTKQPRLTGAAQTARAAGTEPNSRHPQRPSPSRSKQVENTGAHSRVAGSQQEAQAHTPSPQTLEAPPKLCPPGQAWPRIPVPTATLPGSPVRNGATPANSRTSSEEGQGSCQLTKTKEATPSQSRASAPTTRTQGTQKKSTEQTGTEPGPRQKSQTQLLTHGHLQGAPTAGRGREPPATLPGLRAQNTRQADSWSGNKATYHPRAHTSHPSTTNPPEHPHCSCLDCSCPGGVSERAPPVLLGHPDSPGINSEPGHQPAAQPCSALGDKATDTNKAPHKRPRRTREQTDNNPLRGRWARRGPTQTKRTTRQQQRTPGTDRATLKGHHQRAKVKPHPQPHSCHSVSGGDARGPAQQHTTRHRDPAPPKPGRPDTTHPSLTPGMCCPGPQGSCRSPSPLATQDPDPPQTPQPPQLPPSAGCPHTSRQPTAPRQDPRTPPPATPPGTRGKGTPTANRLPSPNSPWSTGACTGEGGCSTAQHLALGATLGQGHPQPRLMAPPSPVDSGPAQIPADPNLPPQKLPDPSLCRRPQMPPSTCPGTDPGAQRLREGGPFRTPAAPTRAQNRECF